MCICVCVSTYLFRMCAVTFYTLRLCLYFNIYSRPFPAKINIFLFRFKCSSKNRTCQFNLNVTWNMYIKQKSGQRSNIKSNLSFILLVILIRKLPHFFSLGFQCIHVLNIYVNFNIHADFGHTNTHEYLDPVHNLHWQEHTL